MPREFFIHNGKVKLITKMLSSKEALEILSVKDLADQTLQVGTPEETESYLKAQFGKAFNRLFPEK